MTPDFPDRDYAVHKHPCTACGWHFPCTCADPASHHGFCFECAPVSEKQGTISDNGSSETGGQVEIADIASPNPDAIVSARWDLEGA